MLLNSTEIGQRIHMWLKKELIRCVEKKAS